MYSYKIGISAEDHDRFAIASDQTNLLQSASWAKIKDNWANERVGIYENDQLVAVASLLYQPLPMGFTIVYIPRGPIMDYTNGDLVNYTLTTLRTLARQKRALFIKFDPAILLRDSKVNEVATENPDAQLIIGNLQAAGCEWVGETTDIAENIQPRYQANLYAADYAFDNLPKKTKQNIKTARNKGVQVQFGGSELLEDFADLMKKTEARKGISLRGLDYYQKLLATYPDQSYVTMATLNLKERAELLDQQLQKAIAEKATFTENTRKNKVENNQKEIDRLTEEIKFLKGKQSKTKRDIVPLAATISLEFGDTSENIYAGMDDDYKHYQPAILTWYETAAHAFKRGSRWQNMGGIENQMDGGLYQFKSKFDPTIEEFIGEFNLPVNSLLYKLSNTAYTIRKKLRSKH
ncbi:aminoacyltransferase [Streptococcus caprae]|uniref:Aminoacyltransferase n=1 Tax=Streptococcus caprae TaxID=1640501 RepID=A0ABV8CUN7_9STRE